MQIMLQVFALSLAKVVQRRIHQLGGIDSFIIQAERFFIEVMHRKSMSNDYLIRFRLSLLY